MNLQPASSSPDEAARSTMRTLRKLKSIILLLRPFTLLAPFSGILGGAMIASRGFPGDWNRVIAGCLAASLLNGTSNGINQVFDLEIDTINQPKRPLPRGDIGKTECILYCVLFWIAGLLLALSASVLFTVFYTVGSTLILSYSIPPLRTKRFGILANLTIAIPRGMFLLVSGWSVVAHRFSSLGNPEIWYLGMIFSLFLLGATTVKDFPDMAGDRECGIRTLPCMLGIPRTIGIISPFFVIPFLLLPLGVWCGLLNGSPTILSALGFLLAALGGGIVLRMRRIQDRLSKRHDRTSWLLMYVLLITGYLGTGAAYAL